MSHMLDQAGIKTIAGFGMGNASAGGIGLGRQVSQATALPPADTVSRDIFSIDGGRILVTGLLGEVTVAIPASSIDFDIAHDPDSGGSNVALATALVCDSDAAGTMYVLNDTFGGALVTSTADYLLNAALEEPFVLGPGDIVWTTTGSGTIGTTARVKWDIWYTPVDAAAVVTAV